MDTLPKFVQIVVQSRATIPKAEGRVEKVSEHSSNVMNQLLLRSTHFSLLFGPQTNRGMALVEAESIAQAYIDEFAADVPRELTVAIYLHPSPQVGLCHHQIKAFQLPTMSD